MTRILGNVLLLALQELISKVNIVQQLVYKDLINIIMLVLNRLHLELIVNTQIQSYYIPAMIVILDVIPVQIIFKILVRTVNLATIILIINV